MNWIFQLLFLCLFFPSNDIYQRGQASYYAASMNGRRTASGERYFSDSLTAASNSRIIDVSWAAAKKLNFVRDGLAQVELKIIDTISRK